MKYFKWVLRFSIIIPSISGIPIFLKHNNDSAYDTSMTLYERIVFIPGAVLSFFILLGLIFLLILGVIKAINWIFKK